MKPRNEVSALKSGASFGVTLTACLCVFAIAVTMLIASFNTLIKHHDQQLSTEICDLVSEKMNNSIRFMTSAEVNMANVLSAQDFDSPAEIYDVLAAQEEHSYTSIGFIDKDWNIYATAQECVEFEKWDLLSTAELADPVAISSPYRSSVSGQPVFTMFTIFRYGQGEEGYMFVTYPLSEIQEIAATQSLKDTTEIWLMNAASANLIQCAGANEYSIGSWANAYLAMRDIHKDDKPAYDAWREQMLVGTSQSSVSYRIGDTAYTQVYAAITHMPGWFVVVRIPSSALSATMSSFRNYVVLFLLVLLVVVVALILLMHRRSRMENRMLEQLSIHDPLTNVLNRRAFDFAAENWLIRKKHVTLLFFDVDYFKQVNDRFGHDGGDRILMQFAASLKRHFSEIGLVSRYGGDEFVVMLDTDDKPQITLTLDALTEEIHAISPSDDPEKNAGFTLTFSAGAACAPEDADSLQTLEQCADSALYEVKRRGRNGYLWYHAEDVPAE